MRLNSVVLTGLAVLVSTLNENWCQIYKHAAMSRLHITTMCCRDRIVIENRQSVSKGFFPLVNAAHQKQLKTGGGIYMTADLSTANYI